MELKRELIIKALECCLTHNGCEQCEYKPFDALRGTMGCYESLMVDALETIKELNVTNMVYRITLTKLYAELKTSVHKTMDIIKSKSTRTAYSCMASGEMHETYTIRGSDLVEIEKELSGGERT